MKTVSKITIIAGIILLIQSSLFSQINKITVVHNGSSTFYSDFSSATSSAVDGDTIYLPGGVITPSEITINKRLTVVGAGHYPDSTTATMATRINVLWIKPGADSGSICGVEISNIQFWNQCCWTGTLLNSYKIERCSIGIMQFGDNNLSQNIIIRECVLKGSSGWFANPPLFEKNIFSNYQYDRTAIFLHNIFNIGRVVSVNSSLINDNIFINTDTDLGYPTIIGGIGSVFNNNLFCRVASCSAGINWGNNSNNGLNLIDKTTYDTFINLSSYAFSYTNNYHLKTTSPAKNAGTDGTDLGIYGTINPYKESAVPFNPHISSKNIGTMVSPTGALNVDVKVSAQDR